MSPQWSILFCRSDDSAVVAMALREALTTLGYELHNPFGALPGKSYRQAQRLFVAPAAAGWVRIIGHSDERLHTALSTRSLCLYAAFDNTNFYVVVYEHGGPVEMLPSLRPFLKPGFTEQQLSMAFTDPLIAQQSATLGGVPLDVLPDDVKGLAANVNPAQTQKLFARLSGNLLGKVTGADAQSAQALLNATPDWNSHGGQRLRAVLNCLALPSDWHVPDFVTLRDAYQLHERKRRNPNARDYPGDAQALAAVPDALSYTPVYGGIA
jgi:hypothetical protein